VGGTITLSDIALVTAGGMTAPLAQQITYFKLVIPLITIVSKFIPLYTERGRFYDPFKNLQFSAIKKITQQTVILFRFISNRKNSEFTCSLLNILE
jgi:hypothetical protein